MKITKTQKHLLLAGAGIVVLVVLYNKYKKQPALVSAKPTTDSNSAGVAQQGSGSGRWRVGGYDSANNRTWIYPDGNLNGGKYTSGSIPLPEGSYINNQE